MNLKQTIKRYAKPASTLIPVLVIGLPLLALAAFGPNADQWLKSSASAGYGGVSNTEYKHVFSANLVGSEEVPPVSTNTTGSGYFNVRMDERTIDYAININNGEDITDAHLHCAPRGQNGPVVVPLYSGTTDVNGELVSGSITQSDILAAGQTCGIGDVPQLVQAMREGRIYANVHSVEHPTGVVRGQLGSGQFTPSPTPTAPTNTGTGNNQQATNSQFITLSDYYRLPQQSFSINGRNFSPNEPVTISFNGQTLNATADGGGNFGIGSFTVPFSLMGQTVAVTAHGVNSNTNSTINLTVGTYAPYGSASQYYVAQNGQVTILGYQFAPNEPVKIFHNGTAVAEVTADGGGNFGTGITVPGTSGNQTYTLIGQQTNLSTNVSLTVAQ